jgi:hypothetical protein
MGVAEDRAQRRLFAKFALELEPQRLMLVIVIAVRHIALAIIDLERQTRRRIVTKAKVHSAFDADLIKIAVIGFKEAAGFTQFGRCRDNVHGTTAGIAAIESALRALQNLDPFEIKEIAGDRLHPRDRDAVDIGNNRRVGGGGNAEITNAADIDLRRGATRCLNAGRKLGEIIGLADARCAQFIAAEDFDGEGGLLDILFAALRGNDDILNAAIVWRGLLRRSWTLNENGDGG